MSVQLKRLLIVGLVVVAMAALMVELVGAVPVPAEVIFVSAAAPGTTGDGLNYEPEDIIVRQTTVFDTTVGADVAGSWFMLFEGDLNGLDNRHDITAFSIWPNGTINESCALGCVDAIYMSFAANAVPVPGIPLTVPGQDIVVYSPEAVGEAYETFFDGSDVGLTTQAEKIDGLDVWGPATSGEVVLPEDCTAGTLFISTQGSYRVPAAEGGSLVGDGSDVLLFCATNLGADTAGFWFRGFDSSDESFAPPQAMSGLDVYFSVISVAEQVEDEPVNLGFYFTANKSFSAPGVSGGPSELFFHEYTPNFVGPLADFNQDEPALNGTVTGLDVLPDSLTPVGE